MKTTLSELYHQSVEPQCLLPQYIYSQDYTEDEYWICLKPGWRFYNTEEHIIYADSKRLAYRHQVIRCFCEECR